MSHQVQLNSSMNCLYTQHIWDEKKVRAKL